MAVKTNASMLKNSATLQSDIKNMKGEVIKLTNEISDNFVTIWKNKEQAQILIDQIKILEKENIEKEKLRLELNKQIAWSNAWLNENTKKRILPGTRIWDWNIYI